MSKGLVSNHDSHYNGFLYDLGAPEKDKEELGKILSSYSTALVNEIAYILKEIIDD